MFPVRQDLEKSGEAFHAEFSPIIGDHAEFYGQPGDRPYRLLSWIVSNLKNQNIIVCDAYRGLSSLALSFDSSNTVYAFSHVGLMDDRIRARPNIKVVESNMMEASVQDCHKELLLSASIIFIDCSPHTGVDEYRFVEFLREAGYNGLILCDHMWSLKSMRDEFWLRISDKNRMDLSLLGNHTGTGAISFDTVWMDAFTYGKKPDLSKWTLVTAYFNLTVCPDASPEIIARDADYYFHHARATLCLPYNLVIYCDKESLPKIQAIRPKEYNTKYVVTTFDDIRLSTSPKTFAEYRIKINDNRRKKPYHFDPRNTASYYLFCLSRYWMLRETIQSNTFGSTHFCWINFCMERMGYKNLLHLEECLAVYRKKFSTCYIDYVPKGLVENTAEYYQVGRCGMCSGFFTGDQYYMFKVCGLIIEKFEKYVEEGYGHADEQLYSPVYFENPDLFKQYFGDYTEMITNYVFVYDRPREPVHNFIRNSFQHGNYELCLRACRVLLQSIALKTCSLDESYMNQLSHYFTQSYIQCIANDINIFTYDNDE